jgi:hypothetical protein
MFSPIPTGLAVPGSPALSVGVREGLIVGVKLVAGVEFPVLPVGA